MRESGVDVRTNGHRIIDLKSVLAFLGFVFMAGGGWWKLDHVQQELISLKADIRSEQYDDSKRDSKVATGEQRLIDLENWVSACCPRSSR